MGKGLWNEPRFVDCKGIAASRPRFRLKSMRSSKPDWPSARSRKPGNGAVVSKHPVIEKILKHPASQARALPCGPSGGQPLQGARRTVTVQDLPPPLITLLCCVPGFVRNEKGRSRPYLRRHDFTICGPFKTRRGCARFPARRQAWQAPSQRVRHRGRSPHTPHPHASAGTARRC